MQIILLQDVPKLGKRGEIKNASDGYARNFLFPRKLAVAATAESLASLFQMKQTEQRRKDAQYASVEALAERVRALPLKALLKCDEKGNTFGSISAATIISLLKEKGITLDKSAIALAHPIKTLGRHAIKIKCAHDIETEIIVQAERE